jgi:hypothetical protein
MLGVKLGLLLGEAPLDGAALGTLLDTLLGIDERLGWIEGA